MSKSAFDFSATRYGQVARFYDWFDRVTGANLHTARGFFLAQPDCKAVNPLEVACGTGDFATRFINAYSPPRYSINDLSKEMLAMAVAKIRALPWNGELKTMEGDATKLNGGGNYDLLILHFVLSAFPSKARREFLKALLPMAAKDVVIWVSDFTKPKSLMILPIFWIQWALGALIFWVFARHKPNTIGGLEEDLEACGLEFLERKYYFSGQSGSFILKKTSQYRR